jgi:hypothetical protein
VVGFIDGLGNQGSGLAHGRQNQNVHRFEDPLNIAAALPNPLEGLDAGDGVDLLRLIEVPLGPGVVQLRRLVGVGF